jgi:hypothetical protein
MHRTLVQVIFLFQVATVNNCDTLTVFYLPYDSGGNIEEESEINSGWLEKRRAIESEVLHPLLLLVFFHPSSLHASSTRECCRSEYIVPEHD